MFFVLFTFPRYYRISTSRKYIVNIASPRIQIVNANCRLLSEAITSVE